MVAKIHHNFDTHSVAWRDMLSELIALCKDRDEDTSYYEHEIKAFDDAFKSLAISVNKGEVSLDGDDIK